MTVALHSVFERRCLDRTLLAESETAAISAHILCTPYNYAPVFMGNWGRFHWDKSVVTEKLYEVSMPGSRISRNLESLPFV